METIKYLYEEGEGITYVYKKFDDDEGTRHELYASDGVVWAGHRKGKCLFSLLEVDDGIVMDRIMGWTDYAVASEYAILLSLICGTDWDRIKILKEEK